MKKIKPVILCGGTGTRLWPMSRTASPKQFQSIDGVGTTTFFQSTVQRHQGETFDRPLVLVNANHVGYVVGQLRDIQQAASIMVEPMSRNTAAALAAAALRVAASNPEQVILSLPSDHLISGDFSAVVRQALAAAEEDNIVVFGIQPTYPETGYGYILEGGQFNGWAGVRKVGSFVEKPELARAQELIRLGGAYWASGISLFKARVLIEEFEKHAPDIIEHARKAVDSGTSDGDILTLEGEAYGHCRSQSCEYAIYEKCQRMALAPADIKWDDVGAWDAFHRNGQKNAEGNVTAGDVLLLDTTNSYVRSNNRLITIIGMNELVVVDTDDALLITDRMKTQNVKLAVDMLAKQRRRETIDHLEKPETWGSSKRLLAGKSFDLVHHRIVPEQIVHLPELDNRSRYFTLIEGIGESLIDGQVNHLAAGASFLVDRGVKCILRNLGSAELHMIEMAVGQVRGDKLKVAEIADAPARQMIPSAHA